MCFGEFIARWGLFNQKLLFGVRDVKHIIDGAFRLHNFLVDWREVEKERTGEENEQENDADLDTFRRESREEIMFEREGILGALDYQEDSSRQQLVREAVGRPMKNMERCKELGIDMRQRCREGFHQEGMKRPSRSNWRG